MRVRPEPHGEVALDRRPGISARSRAAGLVGSWMAGAPPHSLQRARVAGWYRSIICVTVRELLYQMNGIGTMALIALEDVSEPWLTPPCWDVGCLWKSSHTQRWAISDRRYLGSSTLP